MNLPDQSILIVDGESDFLVWAQKQLETPNTLVWTATRADGALRLYREKKPDLLLANTRLLPFNGFELLARVRQDDPGAMVLLTSEFSTTQAVIEATKLGAFDFLRREQLPFNLKTVVAAALREQAEMRAATAMSPRLTVEQTQEDLVGQSRAMQQVFKMIGRVAPSDAPVMITGESGSGKELVARAVHHHSARSKRDFVAVNCAAIPDTLMESELFGHEKGAFTGAVSQRVGRFEQCHGGTLFLDEIGDLPLPLQGKILRVLQEGEFSRVGSNRVLKSDGRIIAATNKSLEEEVAAKRFREDLFYRLNVVRISLPPLRERKEDIRLLAECFLQKVAASKHLPRLQLSEEAVKVMENYPWPGNVRQLENTIHRVSALVTGNVILPRDLPLGRSFGPEETGGNAEPLKGAPMSSMLPLSPMSRENLVAALFEIAQDDPTLPLLPWLEREFTLRAMELTGGNQLRAAKLLGITRATLRKRLELFRQSP